MRSKKKKKLTLGRILYYIFIILLFIWIVTLVIGALYAGIFQPITGLYDGIYERIIEIIFWIMISSNIILFIYMPFLGDYIDFPPAKHEEMNSIFKNYEEFKSKFIFSLKKMQYAKNKKYIYSGDKEIIFFTKKDELYGERPYKTSQFTYGITFNDKLDEKDLMEITKRYCEYIEELEKERGKYLYFTLIVCSSNSNSELRELRGKYLLLDVAEERIVINVNMGKKKIYIPNLQRKLKKDFKELYKICKNKK